jgi:hypothetical protein
VMQHQNKVSKQLWSNKSALVLGFFWKWISNTVVNYQLRRSLFSQTSSNINNRTLTSHHFDKILQPYTHYTNFFSTSSVFQSQQADSFSSSCKENFMRKNNFERLKPVRYIMWRSKNCSIIYWIVE